jgi:hypothetical protein
LQFQKQSKIIYIMIFGNRRRLDEQLSFHPPDEFLLPEDSSFDEVYTLSVPKGAVYWIERSLTGVSEGDKLLARWCVERAYLADRCGFHRDAGA